MFNFKNEGFVNIIRRNRCIIELAYNYQQNDLLKIYEEILNDKSYLKVNLNLILNKEKLSIRDATVQESRLKIFTCEGNWLS